MDFDEAYKATQDMFAENSADNAEAIDTTTTETAPVEPVGDDNGTANEEAKVLDEAVKTADIATQAVADNETKLAELTEQLTAERERANNLEGQVKELSKVNEENLIEEALKPPTLDINALSFADEEEANAIAQKFANDMTAYAKQETMKDIAPFLEEAKAGKLAKEKAELLDALDTTPEFQGIKGLAPQLDSIIANNKMFNDEMSLDDKYINAYLIAKGVNGIKNPVTPEPRDLTNDEVLNLYKSNPELQKMIETERIKSINGSQQVPPMSASGGAVNAALNIKEKPKTLDEAFERTLEDFSR